MWFFAERGWRQVRVTDRVCGGCRAVFTDAVMSVKTARAYCRLTLRVPKPTFFTDAATL